MNVKNHPSTIVATVALITSIEVNSWRTGGSGGEDDRNKSDAIVSMHLADDSNNDLDDDDESVKSFESDDSRDGRTKNDDKSIIDRPITTSELEDDITSGVVTTNDDNNDDNSVDNDTSDDNSDDGSSGDASDSNDKSDTSVFFLPNKFLL